MSDTQAPATTTARYLLMLTIACAAACTALLIVGTKADYRAIDALNRSHRFTTMAYSGVTEKVNLEAGTKYIIVGSALYYQGKVHIDVTDPSGRPVVTEPESGKIRGGWVVASLVPAASGEYTFEISGNAFIDGYIADDSLRHYSILASALLPSGLVLGGVAFFIFIFWARTRFPRASVPVVPSNRWRGDRNLPPPN